MANDWDPPDPSRPLPRPPLFDDTGEVERPRRGAGLIALIAVAMLGGGVFAYALSTSGDDAPSVAIPVTAAPLPTAPVTTTTVAATTVPPTTVSPTTVAATVAPTTVPPTTVVATVAPTDAPTTLPATTLPATTAAPTVPPTAPPTTPPIVTGEHMVFHNGFPLGQVTRTGFVAYPAGAPAPLRLGEIQVTSISRFAVGGPFPAVVRSLDPSEQTTKCPVAAGPRPADNSEPLGLWVENADWPLVARPATVVPFGPNEQAILTAALTAVSVVGVPPPRSSQAISVDLRGDGVPDTVITANYRDADIYYRVLAIAADGNAAGPLQSQAIGGSIADADSTGRIGLEAIADLTGDGVPELVVTRSTAAGRGVGIESLDFTVIAQQSCP